MGAHTLSHLTVIDYCSNFLGLGLGLTLTLTLTLILTLLGAIVYEPPTMHVYLLPFQHFYLSSM